MVIVPRVEDTIVSKVTVSRPPQRHLPRSPKLSPGQQAVVKAALSILVNKAVLQSCPLPRTGAPPADSYMLLAVMMPLEQQ